MPSGKSMKFHPLSEAAGARWYFSRESVCLFVYTSIFGRGFGILSEICSASCQAAKVEWMSCQPTWHIYKRNAVNGNEHHEFVSAGGEVQSPPCATNIPRFQFSFVYTHKHKYTHTVRSFVRRVALGEWCTTQIDFSSCARPHLRCLPSIWMISAHGRHQRVKCANNCWYFKCCSAVCLMCQNKSRNLIENLVFFSNWISHWK